MTRIVVVGSANVDFVVLTPHIPAPGETVLGRNFVMAMGGKGQIKRWVRPVWGVM